jgi:hypothetical protein
VNRRSHVGEQLANRTRLMMARRMHRLRHSEQGRYGRDGIGHSRMLSVGETLSISLSACSKLLAMLCTNGFATLYVIAHIEGSGERRLTHNARP